jgi:hypothetical protein
MSDQALDSLEASVCPIVVGKLHRAGVVNVRRVLFWVWLLAALLTTGCKPQETLFESNFVATTVNQPPSPTQQFGTATFAGGPGSVKVVTAPPNASPPTKWVRISRAIPAPDTDVPLTMFQGNMTKAPGKGKYIFTTLMFIPTGPNNVASIQFGTQNQPLGSFAGFFHLDFLKNNRIRIDDDESTVFGKFPRDQPFMVHVTLDVTDSSAKAHIVLVGAGTEGQADRDVFFALRQMGQFGSVRIWMGNPFTGEFDAANVLVTRNQ